MEGGKEMIVKVVELGFEMCDSVAIVAQGEQAYRI